MKAEFLRVSDWVREIRRTYGSQVVVGIVDPQSLGGLWKVLRHRIRRYPTFLIDGEERIVGWEGDPNGAIRRVLARHSGVIPEDARA